MAPREPSPRGSDSHRRHYNDRREPRDSRDARDNRPRRDRSPDRERGAFRGGRDSHRDQRRRSRSRSPTRNSRDNTRQRSPPRRDARGGGAPTGRGGRSGAAQPRDAPRGRAIKTEEPTLPIPEDEDEEAQMKRIMGFAGFKSTKNTKVPGNDKLYAVRKDKQTQYRQYMNRVGGFNRPLSPSRM